MNGRNHGLIMALPGVALAGLLYATGVVRDLPAAPETSQSLRPYSVGNTAGWVQANSSGFGTAHNEAIHRLSVFNDYLYAGTGNDVNGGQVWRTSSGATWTQVNVSGFGNVANEVARVGVAFNGRLYVGTENPGSGAEIWRCALCDGSDWTRVVSAGLGLVDNYAVGHIEAFSGTLYATVNNTASGARVWKSASGDSGDWSQTNTAGFGDGRNTELWGIGVLNGYLYVSTAQWEAYDTNTHTGIEVWRTQNGSNWQQVNADGFGNRNNVDGCITTFNNTLYVGTYNPSSRAQVWRCATCAGSDWSQVSSSGFGDTNNDGIEFMLPFGADLYATTHNASSGTEAWVTGDGLHWAQMNRDGFGNSHNKSVYSGAVFNSHLFLGLKNSTQGGQVWLRLHLATYLPLVYKAGL